MNGEQETTSPNTPVGQNDPSRDGTATGTPAPVNLERKPTVGITEALSQGEVGEVKESTIRTFQSDVAGAVKSDNISMIKIALAEKERREHEGSYADLDVKKPIKPAYILAGVIILAVLLSLGFVYWYLNKPPSPTLEQLLAPQEPEIVYSETQSAVSIDKKTADTLIVALRKEALAKLDIGTIKRILVTTSTGTSTRNINSTEFLSAVKSRASDSLRRSIEPYFVIGAYSSSPNDAFIIFKINSYDIAYPGMLAWEQYMDVDLSNLFLEKKAAALIVVPPPVIATTSIPAEFSSSTPASTENGTSTDMAATSTDINTDTASAPITTEPVATTSPVIPGRTTNDPNKAVWKDRILQNKDTRILVNPDGTIKFLYSFIDKNTLVIVSSEKGFKEIITRVTTGRISR